jgi:hypothetical protein
VVSHGCAQDRSGAVGFGGSVVHSHTSERLGQEEEEVKEAERLMHAELVEKRGCDRDQQEQAELQATFDIMCSHRAVPPGQVTWTTEAQ